MKDEYLCYTKKEWGTRGEEGGIEYLRAREIRVWADAKT